MSTWSVVLTAGGTPTNVTSLVLVPSIVRNTRLFTSMRSNVNFVNLRLELSAALWAILVGNTETAIAITKDGAAYFTGVVSPNYKTEIVDGRRYVDLMGEDYTLSRLGKTIATTTTYAGYKVSTPSTMSASLLHAIASGAGVSLAAGEPTISSVIPYVCVLPDDKMTWGQLLSDILFEYGYCFYFLADGTMALAKTVNTGSLTTTNTFEVGTNVNDRISAGKKPVEYDDIRVSFKTVEMQSGIILFEDTSGGDANHACNITLNAHGDAGGKDFYPTDSGTVEIFSTWNNPDGKDIWIATAASLSSSNVIPSGVTLSRSFTNYYRRCSFAYHNTAAGTRNINKLQVTGDAYVVTSENVARSTTSGGLELFEYNARYVFDAATAGNLAKGINQYYSHSDFTYTLKSKSDFALGEYVQLTDAIYSGISQKCRIVEKIDGAANDMMTYSLEAVADFVSITITTEGTGKPVTSQVNAIAGYALKSRTVYKRSMTLPTTPSGSSPSGWQEYPPGGTDTLWASDGWGYASGLAITDALMSTTLLMSEGIRLWANTWSAPRQVIETSEMLTPRYLGKYTSAQPAGTKPGDWWLFYASSDTPTQRGVWANVNGTPSRISDDVSANARYIAPAMSDILWAVAQGTYGVITDYATVTFIAHLASEVAFIENLFAQFITMQSGGVISASSGKVRISDAGIESRTRDIDATPQTNDRKTLIEDDTLVIKRYTGGAWDVANSAVLGMNSSGSAVVCINGDGLYVAYDGSSAGATTPFLFEKGIKLNSSLHASTDEQTVYAALSSFMDDGASIVLNGSLVRASIVLIVSKAIRSGTTITLYGITAAGSAASIGCSSGSSYPVVASLAW